MHKICATSNADTISWTIPNSLAQRVSSFALNNQIPSRLRSASPRSSSLLYVLSDNTLLISLLFLSWSWSPSLSIRCTPVSFDSNIPKSCSQSDRPGAPPVVSNLGIIISPCMYTPFGYIGLGVRHPLAPVLNR